MKHLVIASLAFGMLMMTACTKSRSPHFAQGQGENLLKISDYDGKTFEIQTGSPIAAQQQNFSKAQTLDVKAKALGADAFSVVNYEVNDATAKKLLGTTAIVGRPNTKYDGLIRVTQSYLKVFKVANEKDLPINEVTYSEKLSDGRLAVPLMGYPLTAKVSTERSKNDLQENTSTVIEKSQEDVANATYFRIDYSKPELFEAVVKTDVLPVTFFTGEWYYTETITSTPEADATNIGFGGGTDTDLQPSTRVKFISDEQSLTVVNVNLDDRLVKKQEEIEYSTTMSIPVEWKAYKVSANGTGMSEQEDGRLHWSKRPYVQMNLGGVTTLDKSGGGRLVALEVTDTYLSFTVEKKDPNIRIKYAFLRVPPTSTYAAKRYFQDDKKIFGFFQTHKAVVSNYEISRKEDLDKNIFISRFNPNNKEIVYHFTKTTPQWIRPAVTEAIEHWNQAFQAAGTAISVKLDLQDVELGDLRYNAINVVESLSAANLFGFGPSVTDPKSGEIISATTNVHLTPIREAIIEEIRTYIAMKLNFLDEGKIFGISSQLAGLNFEATAGAKAANSTASDKLADKKTKKSPEFKLYMPNEKNPKKMELISIKKAPVNHSCDFDVAIASGNIHQEIERQCPEVLKYVSGLKGTNRSHSDEELEILDSCSRKMAIGKFLGTLVHEMGHNFGLRHNFMGSNDVANFWPIEKTLQKSVVRSSSVMEYPAFNEDRLVMPGKYDIAAIRFGYADSIETANNELLKLDVNKSIAANLKVKGKTGHSYKYCTDEDVDFSIDPMCQRHDAGVTPLEVVRNKIADYQASYQTLNFRREGIRVPNERRLAAYRMSDIFLPLARFYSEWRSGVARYLGEDEQYLERLNKEQMASVVAKMKEDPNFKVFTNQYKPAADEIFNFFYSVMTMENRYCVVKNSVTRIPELVELEKVRSQLFFTKKQSPRSCAEAADYLAEKKQSLVAEIGYYLNTFRYDLSPNLILEPNDVVGTGADRANAALILTQHQPTSADAELRGFVPSFMDEPVYREKMTNYMLYRVQRGIPGNSITRYLKPGSLTSDEMDFVNKNAFLNFSAEKELIGLAIDATITGLVIPGKEEASYKRIEQIRGYLAKQLVSEQRASAAAIALIPGVGYFVVESKNAMDAIALVNTYNRLNRFKNLNYFDVTDKKNAALVAALQGALPSDVEAKTITVKEMYKRYQDLGKSLETVVDETTAQQGAFLISGLQTLQSLFGSLAEALQDPSKAADANKLAATPIAEVFKNSGQEFWMTKENILKIIAKNNDGYAYYQMNRIELDSQIDIMTQVLIGVGRL